MNRKILTALIFGLALGLALLLFNCGGDGNGGGGDDDDDDGQPTVTKYIGTQAPGDLWDVTLEQDTFEAKNVVTGYTYSGSVSELPSLFLKLTIEETTDPDVDPDDPEHTPCFYAVVLPQTAVIIIPVFQPIQANVYEPAPILAASVGTCPDEEETYNWINIPWPDWDSESDPSYGYATSEISDSNFDFDIEIYKYDGTYLGSDSETGYTCSSGKLTKSGSDMVIAVTPSGALIGDNGEGQGGIAGLVRPASNIDLDDVIKEGREYRGILWSYNVPDNVKPDIDFIWARYQNGEFQASHYIDVETGEEAPYVTIIDFGEQNPPGVVEIIKQGGYEHTFVGMINQLNGKYILYSTGLTYYQEDPEQPYPCYVLLIEQ